MSESIIIAPVDRDRLPDAEAVFGDCSYGRKCWCAYWYRPNADFRAGWGDGNREYFRAAVARGEPLGIVGYRDGVPVGWCSVAPRERFDRLRRSKPFAPVDDVPVWSVNCFIVRKGHRRQGLLRQLLRHAVDHARANGAACVEGYPLDTPRKPASSELYVGTLSAFLDEGFTEVARRLPTRPIVRLMLD